MIRKSINNKSPGLRTKISLYRGDYNEFDLNSLSSECNSPNFLKLVKELGSPLMKSYKSVKKLERQLS
jgi:hypothetical protein